MTPILSDNLEPHIVSGDHRYVRMLVGTTYDARYLHCTSCNHTLDPDNPKAQEEHEQEFESEKAEALRAIRRGCVRVGDDGADLHPNPPRMATYTQSWGAGITITRMDYEKLPEDERERWRGKAG